MKNIIFLLTGLIFLIGCKNKQETIKNVELTSEEDLYDESIKTSSDDDEIINNYFTEIFQNDNYIILDEPLKTGEHNIWFAINYMDKYMEIFNEAIGFEIIDGILHEYITYKNFTFFHENGTMFMGFSPEEYKGIYGFGIEYSYPKAEGYTPGLVVKGYFDNGKRIADSFTIEWDEEKKQFKKRVYNFEY
ncbi:MAG: hypothetical protein Ta2B_18020 [Termitinemataceae bacterium]|nr:MAG: hypothetical protein Ta2B_18020 [Termitinemataceae bacterium]